MNRSLSAPPPTAKLKGNDDASSTTATAVRTLRSLPAVPVLQRFQIQADRFNWTLTSADDTVLGHNGSQFDQILHRLRADRIKQLEAARLLVDCSIYKCLKGDYGLTIQLCPERPHEKHSFHAFHRVCERFSPHRLNFVSLRPTEMLLQLEDKNEGLHSIVMTTKMSGCRLMLLPFINRNMPQTITEGALKVATEVMLLSKCTQFVIGFKSLMPRSEVNQLHFELIYSPYACKLPQQSVERVSDGLYVLKKWLLPGFVTQLTRNNLTAFCRQCAVVTNYLGKLNQPFSLLLCRAGAFQPHDNQLLPTAYVFPRQPVSCIHPHRGLRPTGMDMTGVVSIHSVSEFQNICESQVVRSFRDFVQIDADTFQRLTNELKNHQHTDNSRQT